MVRILTRFAERMRLAGRFYMQPRVEDLRREPAYPTLAALGIGFGCEVTVDCLHRRLGSTLKNFM